MGAVDPRITDAIFVVAFFTIFVTSLELCAFRFVATPLRYTVLAFFQGTLVAGAAWLLAHGDFAVIVAGTQEWLVVGRVAGWIVGLGMVLLVASPLTWAALVLMSIRQHRSASRV